MTTTSKIVLIYRIKDPTSPVDFRCNFILAGAVGLLLFVLKQGHRHFMAYEPYTSGFMHEFDTAMMNNESWIVLSTFSALSRSNTYHKVITT
jgi:hypothetical protein